MVKMMSEELKISKRTQALLKVLDFQLNFGHGVGFNQLKEITGFEHGVLSKCHDDLSDRGLLEDVWYTDGETWSKVMQIPRHSVDFVIRMRDEIEEEIGCNI